MNRPDPQTDHDIHPGLALPNFDLLLREREANVMSRRVFGNHVHWGYWERPSGATCDEDDISEAVERLDREVIRACEPGEESGASILDAGCGFGGTLRAMGRAGRGHQLVGLNIDARQIDVARRTPVGGDDDDDLPTFVQGDACRLPFSDSTFDRVLAVECIVHFDSRLTFLSEVARVLRPGGRLVLTDFVPSMPWLASVWLQRLVQREIGKGYGTIRADWSSGSYRDMARAVGLSVVLDRDVTRQTAPTYRALIRMMRAGSMGGRGGPMWRPTRWLQVLTYLGLLRYRLLALDRGKRTAAAAGAD